MLPSTLNPKPFATSQAAKEAAKAAAEAAGFEAMDEMDMFAPLVVTFFCTTTGLIVFFTCPYAYFDVLPHPGLGTDSDVALRDELLAMSVSQLRRRAMAAKVPDDDLAEVLNQLQDDTAPLADLILNTECSSHRKALVALQTMTIAELVDKASAVGVDDEALDAALDATLSAETAEAAASAPKARRRQIR